MKKMSAYLTRDVFASMNLNIFFFFSRHVVQMAKMTKKDMLKCYKDLSTCDMDKVEHVVNAIYQAFDSDNDGKVGRKERS